MQTGEARLFDIDLRRQRAQARPHMGVVFQSPALDGKLSVAENLRHQGHLYGLRGGVLAERIQQALQRFGLQDRSKQRTEHLSGGLQRRVELAKSLLHRPRLLILDEPSTGLDPGARHDLWSLLEEVRTQDGVTVLMTTHILEEAEGCDRVAILDRGQLVVIGAPATLESQLGGAVISIRTNEPRQLMDQLEQQFAVRPRLVGGQLRIQDERGAELLRQIVDRFGSVVASVTLARPTLEDVFIHYTGREFHEARPGEALPAAAVSHTEDPIDPVPHETAER
jgi:ABC-2 type transport system ATP-binding protein